MSLSNCPKCWDNPCTCGSQYEHLSKADLLHLMQCFEEDLKKRFDHALSPRIKVHTWLPEGLNKRASLIAVRIGHEDDTDYILLNGAQQLVSFRGTSEVAHECYLDDGTPAKICRVYRSVAYGKHYAAKIKIGAETYERVLRQGEFVWFTEQAFDRAFYPFVYEDDHKKKGRWRVPLDSYQEALNYKAPKENEDA